MRATLFLATILLLLLLNVYLVMADGKGSPARDAARAENLALAKTLRLTDLALWTEARYTRHPSQADTFTPFQSGPSLPDHFPAGSWVPPPPLFEPDGIDPGPIREEGVRP